MKRERPVRSPWRAPTRRAFFAMLGATAATLAVRRGPDLLGEPDDDRPRRTWTGKTRWIGHC